MPLGAGGWLGGNGQSLASMIDQINTFTDNYDELIILDLSHGLDTDNFDGDADNHLTQDDWNNLINGLLHIKHLVTGAPSSSDLSAMLVSDFIADRPAVIIIIDDEVEGGGGVVFNSNGSGFFPASQLSVYNRKFDIGIST